MTTSYNSFVNRLLAGKFAICDCKFYIIKNSVGFLQYYVIRSALLTINIEYAILCAINSHLSWSPTPHGDTFVTLRQQRGMLDIPGTLHDSFSIGGVNGPKIVRVGNALQIQDVSGNPAEVLIDSIESEGDAVVQAGDGIASEPGHDVVLKPGNRGASADPNVIPNGSLEIPFGDDDGEDNGTLVFSPYFGIVEIFIRRKPGFYQPYLIIGGNGDWEDVIPSGVVSFEGAPTQIAGGSAIDGTDGIASNGGNVILNPGTAVNGGIDGAALAYAGDGSTALVSNPTILVTFAMSPYTIVGYDGVVYEKNIIVDATGGAVVIVLPNASAVKGAEICVKKIDVTANTVTVSKAGSNTIEGAASKVLSARWDKVRLGAHNGLPSTWLVW